MNSGVSCYNFIVLFFPLEDMVMGYRGEKAREVQLTAAELLEQKFGGKVEFTGGVSAQYVAFGTKPVVIGVTTLRS